VDRSASAGNAALLQKRRRFAAELEHSPRSRTARAGWAYATFQLFASNRAMTRRATLTRNLDGAAWMLRTTPLEGSQELYRIRFLVESAAEPSPSLLPAARRLRQALPEDRAVKSRYAFVLAVFEEKENVSQEAVRLANELVREEPRNAGYRGVQGMAYWMRVGLTRKREDGEAAMRAYQKAETLLKDAEARAFTRLAVQRIQDYMKRLGIPEA
jgi:hypothetical protein